MTHRVILPLVMPMVITPQVIPRLMEPLVLPMVKVLQVMLRLTMPLVMMMVGALQVMVLRVGPHVSGHLLVLCVGPGHSWRKAWRALLARLLAGPGSVCCHWCWGCSSPTLAQGGDLVGEGATGDAMVMPKVRAL